MKRIKSAVAAGLAGAIGLTGLALAQPAGATTPATQRVLTELGRVQGLLPTTGAAARVAAPVGQSQAPARIALKGAKGGASQAGSRMTVEPDALPDTDSAVIADADAVSHVFVLRSARAATDVSFTVTGFDGRLVADPLGGVLLVDQATGRADSRISAPWAYDAKGRPLPTSYTVDGDTVTQHVDTRGAAFPVVADPHYTWGWITGTVYFNRNETSHMASDAGFTAAMFAFAPPPFNLIGAMVAGNISRVAWNANSDHKCVKVKSLVPVFPASEYSGGYCR
ncbi:hypothetical protein PUR71_37900 [Streptomyces sp. SP17BM10]|uniref:hypothetical protein n=1 Tax=Streptomyces sp. SP17BM10 TaxID=3002530 RepID=UPI002E76F840|nr:hypothetical protein [Streptomyces sp. SP17BM10]MEE1788636.1 hypothetical protein [Streptomyces sp. SP17BM10]